MFKNNKFLFDDDQYLIENHQAKYDTRADCIEQTIALRNQIDALNILLDHKSGQVEETGNLIFKFIFRSESDYQQVKCLLQQ